jgi:hypothetical protein
VSNSSDFIWKALELAGVWASALATFYAARLALSIANRFAKANLLIENGVGYASKDGRHITYEITDLKSSGFEEVIHEDYRYIIRIFNHGSSDVFIKKILFKSSFPLIYGKHLSNLVGFKHKYDLRKNRLPIRIEPANFITLEYNKFVAGDLMKYIYNRNENFIIKALRYQFPAKISIYTTRNEEFSGTIPEVVKFVFFDGGILEFEDKKNGQSTTAQ